MRVNLSDIEDRSFEALPAGKYIVEFTSHEMRETKDKPENKLPAKTPMINWEMTVIRALDGSETYKGRKLWTNTILHEKTLFNLKSILKACGWTDEQLSEEIDFEPEDVIGHEVLVVVAVRVYNDDNTNDVKRFSAVPADAGASSLLP